MPKVQLSENVSDVFTVKFSPDSQLVAAGCGDGGIRVFNAGTGRLSYNLNVQAAGTGYPTTCIRFRPATGAYKTRNVLLAANADGTGTCCLGRRRRCRRRRCRRDVCRALEPPLTRCLRSPFLLRSPALQSSTGT